MSEFGYPLYPVAPTNQQALSSITGNTTLGVGAATYSKHFFITGAGGYTITLPALDGVNFPTGSFSIFNNSSALCTVTAAGSDTMLLLGTSYSSVSILPGERFLVQNMVSNYIIGLESPQRTTTAPQFDSTIRSASTAFVQRALGNTQGVVNASGNLTLTTAQLGSFVEISSGAPFTITLPATSVGIGGGCFYFFNPTSGSVTIAANGAQSINNGLNNAGTYVLGGGNAVTLITDGASWSIISGHGTASLGSSGYQKLPSGLILQWGTTVVATTSDITTTLPIAFPNSFYQVNLTQGYAPGTGSMGYGGATPSTLSAFIWRGTPAGNSFLYLAIGR